MSNIQKTYALILGLVLGIIGVWGFFTQSVLGLGVNTTQSVLHVIAAIFGIYVGTKGEGPGFNMTIGWIGILLAILGFIPATATMLTNWLNINTATTILHLVIGILSLGIYYAAKK